MKQLKFVLTLAGISVAAFSLAACQIVATPVAGWVLTDVKYGFNATDEKSAPKEGKSCAKSILGWVATGDASIAAAKAAGGITTVASVDHSANQILGIVGDWCTIVRGN